MAKRITNAVCIGLLVGLILLKCGVNPLNWLPVVQVGPPNVCIVEETADRPKLLNDKPGVLAVINGKVLPAAVRDAGGKFFGCVDKDIIDKSKQPPPVLLPFLNEAKILGHYPALVIQRGSNIRAVDVPDNDAAAVKEVMQ
jgi:hypothetical protein